MEVSDRGTWVHKFIEQWTIRISKRFVHNAEYILQMGEGARPNNGRGDTGLIFDPKQR
jgi:hypothetical protein